MNRKIYISVLLVVLMFGYSCELDEYLDNPNEVTADNAQLDLYLNAAEIAFANFFTTASDLSMPFVRMTAMTGGNVYNNQYSPSSFDGLWGSAYSEFMPDADLLIAQATESELFVHAGIGKVMKAYILMTLVDMFGVAPLTQANSGELNPAADSGDAVYAAALVLLDDAIADFAKVNRGEPSNDLVYGGSANKWLGAANSLKLKYLITTRLVGSSGSEFAAIINAGNYISSPDDDFVLSYGTNRVNPDSRHPYYGEHYETANGRYQSNAYMNLMLNGKDVVDPRLRYYFYRQDCNTTDEDQFTLACATEVKPPYYADFQAFCVASEEGWWGRDHGDDSGIPPDGAKRTVFGLYPAGGKFDADNCSSVKNGGTDGAGGEGISPIMTTSFVDFMRAEAAMTMGTGEDAKAMLEQAIRGSMDKVRTFQADQVPADFAMTDDNINAYVNVTLSGYDAAATDDEKLNIIATEYYLALWTNGMEAYNLYRRTGYPSDMQLTVKSSDSGTYPRSVFLPSVNVNLNSNASQKELSEQVFWDTNPAGFIN